jgi:uracil-DNA glycosylase
MTNLEILIAEIQQEAKRETFPIDIPVYEQADLEPTKPILYAGNLKSQLCFFGRDLGKDEVFACQPLYGAAGTLVRQGFYQSVHNKKTSNKKELQTVCDRVLLTNTVPYKPPGNKAYSMEVKQRFRPFVERLLVLHWEGNSIIPLGNEALDWFSPYGGKNEVAQFLKSGDARFSGQLNVTLRAFDDRGMEHQKKVVLLPLPHPSPLNQKYYGLFPQMLQKRLDNFAF